MELRHLQNDIDRRYKAFRCVSTMVNSEKFTEAFEKANQDQRELFALQAHQCDLKAMKKLVRKILYGDLESMNLRELKEIALSLKVKDYNYMGKAELLGVLSELTLT